MSNRIWPALVIAAAIVAAPAPARAQNVYQHLELIAETLARIENECPARVDAAMASSVARLNALPHRAAMTPVPPPAGREIYPFLDSIADAVAGDEDRIDDVSYALIDGMMRGVDPRSYLLGFEPSERGNIGAEVRAEGGVVTIDSVREGGPAARAGLAVGDAIISIDTQSAQGLSRNDAESLLRGIEGSEVAVVFRAMAANRRLFSSTAGLRRA